MQFIRSNNLVADNINIAITGATKGSKLLSSDYVAYTTYSTNQYLGAAIVIRYINDATYQSEVISDLKHQILLALCEAHPTHDFESDEKKYRSLVEDQTTPRLHQSCTNSDKSKKYITQCISKHQIYQNDLVALDSKKLLYS